MSHNPNETDLAVARREPTIDGREAGSGGRWWPALLLALTVLAIYFTRMSEPGPRGEESRRGRVAAEMIESGDFIVPRQQGELFLSRPPLQNWLIAAAGWLRGRVDVVAVRLPSTLAVLATALLIYGYTATFLPPLGAMAAGLAYATMLQVLELGRLGETEALFAALVGGSLLVWHWGDTQDWPPMRKWALAYLLVALATLAKGPQAPVYFGLAVFGWLLWTRRWRELLRPAHLVGAAVFLAVVAAWQGPFYLQTSWEAVQRIYADDVGLRYQDVTVWSYLGHLVAYPLELVGSLLPWSLLLVAFAHRDFRRALGTARGHVLFLAWSVAITFLTCWLTPNAKTRYFMPLYPCFAPVIGLVVQRCWSAAADQRWRRLWPAFLTGAVVGMPTAGLVFLAATWLDHPRVQLGQPWPFVVAYLTIGSALALVAWWCRPAMTASQRALGLLAVATFLGLSVGGAFVNVQLRNGVDTAREVAALRQVLPDDADLVSFGKVDHLFAFHYGDPIPLIPPPTPDQPPQACPEWFCFGGEGAPAVEIPFAYQVVGKVCCDRFRSDGQRRVVVIARRIPEIATASTETQRR